jgi:hypothetical protein
MYGEKCMRFMTIISTALLALLALGCANVTDDGYLSPPGIEEFDLQAATERAHEELMSESYRRVTHDADCREACAVFERGFERARRLRLTSPAKCTDEFEDGLWSQTEYQEGCRAYALKAISLLDQYRIDWRNNL